MKESINRGDSFIGGRRNWASRSFTHFVKRASALIWWSAGLPARRELFTDTILIFGMHVFTVEGIYSDLLNDTCVNRNLECVLIGIWNVC